MRCTVRTHVLIRLHPTSVVAARLPRLSATKLIPLRGSRASCKFAFTSKAKRNSERGPVLCKIYKLSVCLGTEAGFQLVQNPDITKGHPHRCKLFLPEQITDSLGSLCCSLLLPLQTHGGCKALHVVSNI